jgi:hypothetical protein
MAQMIFLSTIFARWLSVGLKLISLATLTQAGFVDKCHIFSKITSNIQYISEFY